MQVSQDIQQKVAARVTECYQIARQKLQREFPLPQVVFNQRGKAAGSARLQLNQIRLNPILLVDNLNHFIEDVLPHEVCHLLTFALYGRVRPHGKEWQTLMRYLFDLAPTPYHQLDTTKVSGKEFDYRCACGPVKLSIRRHNKVQRGQQIYICRTCQQQLEPLTSEDAI